MIEFEPADNFPADDASHGFDNIGDALSLSPLLLERYLDTAEAVVERALATGKAAKPKVRVGFMQFITKGTNLPYRVSLFTSEPLTAEFRLAADGDYLLRLEGKAAPPADVAMPFAASRSRKNQRATVIPATQALFLNGKSTVHTSPGGGSEAWWKRMLLSC